VSSKQKEKRGEKPVEKNEQIFPMPEGSKL